MNQLSLLPVAILLIVVLLTLGGLGDLLHALRELQRQIVVLSIRGVQQLSRFGVLSDELSHLLHELKRHMPVYSAETVRGEEAEFIRDGLPKRFPLLLVVVALLFAAAAWWFGR
jgi:hypothetical protein